MDSTSIRHTYPDRHTHPGKLKKSGRSSAAKRLIRVLLVIAMVFSLALTNTLKDQAGGDGKYQALAEDTIITDIDAGMNDPLGIVPAELQLPIDLDTAATNGTGYTISGTAPNKVLTFDISANPHTYTITQTGASQFNSIIFDNGVTIGDGSTMGVTLDGISFTGIIELKGDADITLLLADGKINIINGNIIVPETSPAVIASLTISSASGAGSTDGFLEVENDEPNNAAIGGGNNQSAGNITIKGGAVHATNSGSATAYGAGIGGGAGGSGGTITISGGAVYATGYTGSSYGTGAGIGGGGADSTKNAGNGGQITLTGGTVTAVGYDGPNQGYGAGIGGGGVGGGIGLNHAGDGGTITIAGCTVTAIGGKGSGISMGAGIGGGGSLVGAYPGDGGIITISSGKVDASGYSGTDKGYGAGIGGGGVYHMPIGSLTNAGSGGDIAISGGVVNVSGSDGSGIGYGAAIGGGGGYYNSGSGGSGGDITISGDAEVTAISNGAGAAIGGGGKDGSSGDGGEGGNIIIGDTAKVTAISPNGQSTGIGGGSGYANGNGGSGGTIIIKDISVVFASGGANGGAGIGGGGKGTGTGVDGVGSAITIDPTADVTAYSYGTLPAIQATNDNTFNDGLGGGYFVNAIFEVGALPATNNTLIVYLLGSGAVLKTFNLPANYRGFAYTIPAGAGTSAYDSLASRNYKLSVFDSSNTMLGEVARVSDNSTNILSIINLDGYDVYNTANNEGWLPVKLLEADPGVWFHIISLSDNETGDPLYDLTADHIDWEGTIDASDFVIGPLSPTNPSGEGDYPANYYAAVWYPRVGQDTANLSRGYDPATDTFTGAPWDFTTETMPAGGRLDLYAFDNVAYDSASAVRTIEHGQTLHASNSRFGDILVKNDIELDTGITLNINVGRDTTYHSIYRYDAGTGKGEDVTIFSALNQRHFNVDDGNAGIIITVSLAFDGKVTLDGGWDGSATIDSYKSGGISNAEQLMLKDAIIQNCQNIEGGGVNSTGSLTLDGGKISSNRASYGGGAFVKDSEFEMSSGEISGNKAIVNGSDGGDGGGIFSMFSDVGLKGGMIANNTADIDGGGIYMMDHEQLDVSAGVIFSGNTAASAHWLTPGTAIYQPTYAWSGTPGTPISCNALITLHGMNILTTTRSTAPIGTFKYLYNNYDVNYVGNNGFFPPGNFRMTAQIDTVVEAGKTITYDISFDVPGDISGYDSIRIGDEIPSGLVFMSASLLIGTGGKSPIDITGAITGLTPFGTGTLSYKLEGANLHECEGETVTLSIVMYISTAPVAGYIENNANLYYSYGIMEMPGGEDGSIVVYVSKTASKETFNDNGDVVTFTIGFRLPDDLSGYDAVRIEDVIPPGLALNAVGVGVLKIGGASYGMKTLTVAGNTASYTLKGVELADSAGNYVTLEIGFTVNGWASGPIINKANVCFTSKGGEEPGGSGKQTITHKPEEPEEDAVERLYA